MSSPSRPLPPVPFPHPREASSADYPALLFFTLFRSSQLKLPVGGVSTCSCPFLSGAQNANPPLVSHPPARLPPLRSEVARNVLSTFLSCLASPGLLSPHSPRSSPSCGHQGDAFPSHGGCQSSAGPTLPADGFLLLLFSWRGGNRTLVFFMPLTATLQRILLYSCGFLRALSQALPSWYLGSCRGFTYQGRSGPSAVTPVGLST